MYTGEFFNSSKRKLLSIDGGGMRGVITLAMLSELEKFYGKPAYEIFHMVGGTSTGAIIAAGLSVGMTANEILTIYENHLAKIFNQGNITRWINFVLNGFRFLYDPTPFIDALKPYVENIKIGDIHYPIIFITTKDVRTGNTYYVTSAGAGASLFSDWLLSDAVQASVSAPVYFPPFKNNFIDAGVGIQGNPSLGVITEAMEYIGPDEGFVDNNVILISMGTGYVTNDHPDGIAGKWNGIDWLNYVLFEFIDDTGLQQALSTRAIYGSRIDFRRYNPYLDWSIYEILGIPAIVDNDGNIDKSKNIDPSTLTLDTSYDNAISLMKTIGRLYAENIDWDMPDIMPWDTIGGHPKPKINPNI